MVAAWSLNQAALLEIRERRGDERARSVKNKRTVQKLKSRKERTVGRVKKKKTAKEGGKLREWGS